MSHQAVAGTTAAAATATMVHAKRRGLHTIIQEGHRVLWVPLSFAVCLYELFELRAALDLELDLIAVLRKPAGPVILLKIYHSQPSSMYIKLLLSQVTS